MVISSKTEINSMCADMNVLEGNRTSPGDTVCYEQWFYRFVPQTLTPRRLHAAVSVCCRGTALMMIETHCNTLERQCSVTAQI